jgi:hypothetical protein
MLIYDVSSTNRTAVLQQSLLQIKWKISFRDITRNNINHSTINWEFYESVGTNFLTVVVSVLIFVFASIKATIKYNLKVVVMAYHFL